MCEVIQCLIDWLNKEPSNEKSHRILKTEHLIIHVDWFGDATKVPENRYSVLIG
jgi:hypothetical protein